MTRAERAVATVQKADLQVPSGYLLKVDELFALADKNNGASLDLAVDAFTLGFIRGQRAEKARRKEQK